MATSQRALLLSRALTVTEDPTRCCQLSMFCCTTAGFPLSRELLDSFASQIGYLACGESATRAEPMADCHTQCVWGGQLPYERTPQRAHTSETHRLRKQKARAPPPSERGHVAPIRSRTCHRPRPHLVELWPWCNLEDEDGIQLVRVPFFGWVGVGAWQSLF